MFFSTRLCIVYLCRKAGNGTAPERNFKLECNKKYCNVVISSAVASSMSIHHLVFQKQPSLPRYFISNQQEVEVIWTHVPQNEMVSVQNTWPWKQKLKKHFYRLKFLDLDMMTMEIFFFFLWTEGHWRWELNCDRQNGYSAILSF